MGRAVRSQAGIKVRQPLARMWVKARSDAEKRSIQRMEAQILEEVNVKSLEFGENIPPATGATKIMVELDTNITVELEAEGMAREIVHHLQTMRRSAGYDIADHIIACYEGDAYFVQAISSFADYIKQETLSRELIEGVPEGVDLKETYKISGYSLLLGIKKSE